MSHHFVYIMTESKEEALGIGRALVRERLAACANVLSSAISAGAISRGTSFLKNKIGETKDDFPKYQLSVNSSETEVAEVIKKDATASKFNVQYSIKYNFRKCILKASMDFKNVNNCPNKNQLFLIKLENENVYL